MILFLPSPFFYLFFPINSFFYRPKTLVVHQMIAIVLACKGFSSVLAVKVLLGKAALNVIGHSNVKGSFLPISNNVNEVAEQHVLKVLFLDFSIVSR